MFGARPVKRAVQRELETGLAKALLRGEFGEDDTGIPSLMHRSPPSSGSGSAAHVASSAALRYNNTSQSVWMRAIPLESGQPLLRQT